MSDVFLSYARRSHKHAEALAEELASLGISVWTADKEIRPSDSIREEIFKAIKDAKLVAFVVTPNTSAEGSRWVEWEYMTALEQSWADQGKILLPVLVGNAEPPSFLRHTTTLNVRGQRSDWASAAKAIAKLVREGLPVKHSKAAMRERTLRLALIEKEANALRVDEI